MLLNIFYDFTFLLSHWMAWQSILCITKSLLFKRTIKRKRDRENNFMFIRPLVNKSNRSELWCNWAADRSLQSQIRITSIYGQTKLKELSNQLVVAGFKKSFWTIHGKKHLIEYTNSVSCVDFSIRHQFLLNLNFPILLLEFIYDFAQNQCSIAINFNWIKCYSKFGRSNKKHFIIFC